ncbi:transcription elongation factor GreA/GreB, C-terminal domain protein [Bacteriovorax sp. BSW11_IV]|uniref:GreA/GreB family elongation factor n=1 Tax=Bacteriovorax sp. BSW11_IV TaxID=1353529 RepID=UPI00038A1102|nr:GreA/GreB family elongation factor [Bacteriovorax sp. BSW11_IV]EQC42966.1 transcription elongation factor GreA/GreB, C-terminal domain protein [Bacteriovorax sp. BSW11_IV]
MNKSKILADLLAYFEHEKEKVETTVALARDYISEKDMQQEGKYDTRRIEASYLAGAQGRRLEILKQDVQILKAFELLEYTDDDEIGPGALVHCCETMGKKKKDHLYFIVPSNGGVTLECDGKEIQVLSIHSPLGSELMRLEVNDIIELETPGGVKEVEILALY